MKKSSIIGIITLILMTLILSACAKPTPTEDPVIKITEIASTVIAQLTQTAAAMPTATPTPTLTPTATMAPPTPTIQVIDATSTPSSGVPNAYANIESDDNMAYQGDVTIPDGTIIRPGTSFTKIWKVKNTGLNNWPTGYKLAYLDGLKDASETLYIHVPYTVRPNELVELAVKFTAPLGEGKYESWWRMVNSNGDLFGEVVSLKFVVGQP